MSFRFGDFELDEERRQLRSSGQPVPLEPKGYELLCLLVERRPRALSRAQIRDAIWPATFISESTLGVVVNGLRQALGDDAKEPRFIRTVRGFGYAFCGDVVEETSPTSAPVGDAFSDAIAVPGPLEAAAAAGAASRPHRWVWPALAVGAAGALGLVSWVVLTRGVDPPARQVTRFTLHLAREFVDFGNLDIAPDGSRIAFVAAEADRKQRLYVRELDAFESRPLEGTEGAEDPFFSPDGRWLVFIGPLGQLKKVSVAGGPPIEVGNVPGAHSPVWGSDDTIVVGDLHSRILRMSASGHRVKPLQAFGGSDDRSAPLQLLPDGELLVTTWRKDGKGLVERVSLETGERRTLLRALVDPSGNRLLPSGHFVWGSAGTLLAVRLDLAGGEPAGPPVPVVEGLRSYLGVGHNVAVSDTGTLVYAPSPGPLQSQLVWVDRAGKATPVPGGTDANFHTVVPPRLSPDGREAAIILMEGPDRDIWIFDLERGTRRRLTDEGANVVPRWSPDGSSIAYGSQRGRLEGIFRRPSDGGGAEDLLFEHPVLPFPVAWSPDGRRLAFCDWQAAGVWVHSVGGKTAMVFEGHVESPALSPDWRWLAFQAGETGRSEIYLQPFPGPGPRTVVSTSGGTRPAWSPGGDELFYQSGNRVMAVRLQTTPELRVGEPEVLFEGPYREGVSVSPDGKRFLLLRADPSPITELRVVVNWGEELKRLVP